MWTRGRGVRGFFLGVWNVEHALRTGVFGSQQQIDGSPYPVVPVVFIFRESVNEAVYAEQFGVTEISIGVQQFGPFSNFRTCRQSFLTFTSRAVLIDASLLTLASEVADGKK